LLIALIAGALGVPAAASTVQSGDAAARGAAPTTAAKTCPKGYVHAVIRGVEHCLRRGQRCNPHLDRIYHRYKFHCHGLRKVRLTGGPPTPPKPAPPPPPPIPKIPYCGTQVGRAPAKYDHVIVVWFENKNYNEIVGNRADAPYFNGLARSCGLATNFWANAHVSRRAYLATTGGEIRPPIGVPVTVDNGSNATAPSIFGLTRSWKVYVESMVTNCQRRGTEADPYDHGHNAPIFYGAIADLCKTQDVPMGDTKSGALITDIRNGTLPAYAVVVPNECSSMHRLCGAKNIHGMIQHGDVWLKKWMQALTAGSDYRKEKTAIIVAFDEGKVLTKPSNLQEDCLATRGPTCRTPTIVVAPYIKARKDGTFYTWYSLLKTTQEMLGLTPLLGHAADASTASMRRGLGF
jgi:hypothetical protein